MESPAKSGISVTGEELSRTGKRRQQRKNRHKFLELTLVSSSVSAQRIEELAGDLARESERKADLVAALERESKGKAELSAALERESEGRASLEGALARASRTEAILARRQVELAGDLARESKRKAELAFTIDSQRDLARAREEGYRAQRASKELEIDELRARLGESESWEAKVAERDRLLAEASARSAAASKKHGQCLRAVVNEAAKTKASTDGEIKRTRFLNQVFDRVVLDQRKNIKDQREVIKQLRFAKSQLCKQALDVSKGKVVSFLADKGNYLLGAPPTQLHLKRQAYRGEGSSGPRFILCPGESAEDPIEDFPSPAPLSPSCDFVPATP